MHVEDSPRRERVDAHVTCELHAEVVDPRLESGHCHSREVPRYFQLHLGSGNTVTTAATGEERPRVADPVLRVSDPAPGSGQFGGHQSAQRRVGFVDLH